jgi:hypothetical protein
VGSIWDRLANLHYEVPGIAAKKMNAPDIKAEMEMKVIGLNMRRDGTMLLIF